MTGGQAPGAGHLPGARLRLPDRLGRAALRPPVQPLRPRRGEDRGAGHAGRRVRAAACRRSATTTRWWSSPRPARWTSATTSTSPAWRRCRSASGRVHRAGTDVTVVAVGHLVHDALAVAERARRRGVGGGVRPAHAVPVRLGRAGRVGGAAPAGWWSSTTPTGPAASAGEIIATAAEECALAAPPRRVTRPDGAVLPFAPALDRALQPGRDQLAAAIQLTMKDG